LLDVEEHVVYSGILTIDPSIAKSRFFAMRFIHRFLFLVIFLSMLSIDVDIPMAGEIRLNAPAVAYQPKGFTPGVSSDTLTESQIRDDLHLLFDIGFRGIVTYSSQSVFEKIPEIARSEGFNGIIIMGIWDIFSSQEWRNAIAQIQFVNGYCLGNEGLGVRYNEKELLSQMKRLRVATARPVTTSEPIFKYFQPENQKVLREAGDWLFPIVHPFWDTPFEPKKAAEWTIVHCDYLNAATGRNIIIKEAGYPSSGHVNLNEDAQIAFFDILGKSGLSFFYFEAFDQPWKIDLSKNPLIEAHWGLFNADGSEKKIVAFLKNQWTEP
jgi:exo-beta-1,3-glucanase (GH17 family)